MLRIWSILGFALLLTLANWPYVYEEVLSQSLGGGPNLVTATSIASHEAPTIAGWPCKFYLSVPNEGAAPVVSFGWLPLFMDLCFWAMVPIVFTLYERFVIARVKRSDALVIEGDEIGLPQTGGFVPRRKRVRTSKYERKRKRRSVHLVDIFVATTLVASVFGYWQLTRARGELDKKFANEIANCGGGVMRTAILPWIARDLLGFGGHSVCLRISEVKLVNPDNDLLAKVVALPYLRTLNIAGGNYDFRILNRLATKPLFSELAVVGRRLNVDAIESIRSLQSLRRLNLMRTNITASGVAAIDLPGLRELNLVHTDVRLSELGTPSFSKSIRKLVLPHPIDSSGDSLVLDNWPELILLSCYEYDGPLNREPVALTLKNLPKLYKIELDGHQKFDIDFEDLPALAKLETTFHNWEQRTNAHEIVPEFLWAGKLRLKDIPNLNALTVSAVDTQLIDVEHGLLQINLSVSNKGIFRTASQTNTLTRNALRQFALTADVGLTTRQKWIDDLGKCQGLERINLENIPLEGVSLKPLAENQTMRELVLDNCGVLASQLSDLESAVQLQEISMLGSQVDGRTVEGLVKAIPGLRTIRCDKTLMRALQLEDVANLESISDVPQSYNAYLPPGLKRVLMDTLRIVNAPNFRDSFIVSSPLNRLHIESAPKLSGLSFQWPLPGNAVLKGVKELKFFAAGGPTCTDAIVLEVLRCKGLQRLTLAYTNLDPTTWSKISELRDLEFLGVTGSNIDDEFVQSLAGLQKLNTLRLDQTSITLASIPVVAKLKNLEICDLRGLQLGSEQVTQLISGLPKLTLVSLAGAELTADNMRQIAKLYSLQILDLSGCNLTDELWNAFLESPPTQLIELKLNSATFNANSFRKVTRLLPTTRFGVRNTNLSLNVLDPLLAKGRLTEYDNEDTSDSSFRRLRSSYYSTSGQMIVPPHPSDIDPSKFAPRAEGSLPEAAEEIQRGDFR